MCIPTPKYIYQFMKMFWERILDLLPIAVREVPPNHCQQHLYYSDCKSFLGKYQDNKVSANGKSSFIPGTPIISVSFNHPMNFVLQLMKKQMNPSIQIKARHILFNLFDLVVV
jgi:hypothetical protein